MLKGGKVYFRIQFYKEYSKYGTDDIAITYEDTGNGTYRLGNIKQPTIKP